MADLADRFRLGMFRNSALSLIEGSNLSTWSTGNAPYSHANMGCGTQGV